jgi:BlaI family penicillinase repressor
MIMSKRRPSELELQVLAVLWERGPSTVRDVLASLPDGKQRAYTTVLTVMQGMERKRLVSHTRDGLAHVYKPRVTRDEVVQPYMQTLLQNVFGGSPAQIVQALVDNQNVGEAELREIRKVINAAARQKRDQEDDA